uniref:Ribonuclease H1 N-terminal domain-containing protein n=1 Tax=Kalanchoe fedtschenkoi TaxID=63787 RepID=A0A7N0UD41_KALFE
MSCRKRKLFSRNKILMEEREQLQKEIIQIRESIKELQTEASKKKKEIRVIDTVIGNQVATKQQDKKLDEEEEGAKYHYVIFNGPNRGIYDDWSKAAIFITGHNIVHKKYLGLQEAKKALEEYKPTYAPKIPVQEKMRVTGKVPQSLTIEKIQTQKQREEAARLTKKIFDQEYQFLVNYSDEDKVTSIYPVESGQHGPKAIILPEADPLKTYMMFQAGLISCIYFKNIGIFQYFPVKFKRAIQQYAGRVIQKREGFLKIYATYPVFMEGEDGILQPAIQLCQIGISNGSYSDMGSAEHQDELSQYLNNYVGILLKGIRTKGRIIFSAKSVVLWSMQPRSPREQDVQLLNKFLEDVMRINYPVGELLKKELCIRLAEKFPETHVCEACSPSSPREVVM